MLAGLRRVRLTSCVIILAVLLTACTTGAPAATATARPGPSPTPLGPTAVPPTPVPPASPTPEATGVPDVYLDNRSDPWSLMQSYVNALDRHAIVQAYSYWEPGALGLPTYEEFEQAYADAESVQLSAGTVTGGVGAGQTYYAVPSILTVQAAGGAVQTFAGCYTLHLGSPSAQAVPPFEPLGIRSADLLPVAAGEDPVAVRDEVCRSIEVAGEPYPKPDPADPYTYLDDRSDPAQLVRSFANALNLREYLRAYSYWEPGAPGLPSFDEYAQGYADTQSVELSLGAVTPDAGAGQLRFMVPVVLVEHTADGAATTYSGCYVLHQPEPGFQVVPPFQPLAIEQANVSVAPAGSTVETLLAGACTP